MSQSLICPNIVWIVKDAYSSYEKTSQTYSFLGGKWRLRIQCFPNVRGNAVQLFLERIAPPVPVIETQLKTNTSILTASASYGLTQSMVLNLKESRWCIWDTTVPPKKKVKDITFNCSVLFHNNWQTFLDQNAESENKPFEYSPCMESLCHDFGKMFNNHTQADVILNCCDKKIYAHRNILSARSEVFAAMFRNDMKESRERSVDIIDMEPAVLEQLIRYMYSGEMPNMTPDTAPKIFAAADQYGVDALKMGCALFMMDKSKPLNTEQSAVVAEEGKSKDSFLSHFANVKAVISSEEWQKLSEENPKLAQEAFELFVSRSPSYNN